MSATPDVSWCRKGGARGFEADSQWRAVALSEKAPAARAGFAYFGMLMRRFGQWGCALP